MTPRPITLDELPAWSPWPARLLGLEPFARRERTPDRVLTEYDDGKYGPLLRALDQDPSLGVEDLKALELGDPAREVAMSQGDALFAAPIGEALDLSLEVLVEAVRGVAAGAATIVDLGCGYGHALSRLAPLLPRCALRGGEFAPAGVALGRRLHGERIPIDTIDLLADRPCAPLEAAAGPVVAMTSYVAHQLPSAAPLVRTLARHRGRIAAVVTLEPEEDGFGTSLLGAMRHRYQQLCDYSADVLRVLRARDDIEVLRVEPNVIGANALLPATLAVWRFR